MELFKAHEQWANRPDDERFDTLEALYTATHDYANQAAEKEVPFADVRVEAVEKDIRLVGKQGIPAQLTNWAFGQLSAHVGAPASYLRTLPATLAAQNLNYGLKERIADAAKNGMANLLFHRNGGLLLRAITTNAYARIWNYEVVERLLDLVNRGWEVATPDFNSFDDGRKPLYASDHDMFVFLRNRNITIGDKGTDNPLYRGAIVSNSEVGAASLNLTWFLYQRMCGNHIIWGASEVNDLKIRHVGEARDRVGNFLAQIRQYDEKSVSDLNARILRAKSKIIAATKEEVLDAIFGKRAINISRKALTAGYDAVVEVEDGPANSQWGIVQGLTRYSQTLPYADERTKLDTAAGKILDVTF